MSQKFYTLRDSSYQALLVTAGPPVAQSRSHYIHDIVCRIQSLINQLDKSQASRIMNSALSCIGEQYDLRLPADKSYWAEALIQHPLVYEILTQAIPDTVLPDTYEECTECIYNEDGMIDPESELSAIMSQIITGRRED